MAVQLPNATLGVRRVDPAAVDAHGAPLPAQAGPPSALLPGKVMELDTGQWQLALDPSLWPVRVGDRVVSGDGAEWLAVYVKHIECPPLSAQEIALGLDVSFVRVMANQVTPAGVEPVDSTLVGRTGSPV